MTKSDSIDFSAFPCLAGSPRHTPPPLPTRVLPRADLDKEEAELNRRYARAQAT